MYEHGTLAFYLTRRMAQELAAVDKSVYCRVPIDFHIAAALGPWFSTTRDIARHAGWGHTDIN